MRLSAQPQSSILRTPSRHYGWFQIVSCGRFCGKPFTSSHILHTPLCVGSRDCVPQALFGLMSLKNTLHAHSTNSISIVISCSVVLVVVSQRTTASGGWQGIFDQHSMAWRMLQATAPKVFAKQIRPFIQLPARACSNISNAGGAALAKGDTGSSDAISRAPLRASSASVQPAKSQNLNGQDVIKGVSNFCAATFPLSTQRS